MFLGDKGKPNKYSTTRLNYEIIIDNERMTLSKFASRLGFYTVLFDTKINEMETVYDTDKNLLTSAGLILRKKTSPARTYFSLVRLVSMKGIEHREKKSFLGECEPKDQPSDFPVQIAEEVNKIFNNLFTINLVDIVKHSTPYIITEITGNRYKVVSGTGYEMYLSFEVLNIRDMRTGKRARKRIVSLKFENDPAFEREKNHVLETIERYCKELFLIDRNRFEIAQVAVRPPVREKTEEEKAEFKKARKEKKQKK